jgi:16S rRNA (guanine527-N7)-methyltransferase
MVVAKGAAHLALIEEANRHFNLTRITTPREAAIKHVLDSVMPWRLFAEAKHVLDAGTGAGFPGIPLALTLPETRFTLAESIGKKARFVESALAQLALPNAVLAARRAEELARTGEMDVITARALAPVAQVLDLFAAALKKGVRILLYKGPDAEREIAEASAQGRKLRVRMAVAMRYDLPDSAGARTIVEIGVQETAPLRNRQAEPPAPQQQTGFVFVAQAAEFIYSYESGDHEADGPVPGSPRPIRTARTDCAAAGSEFASARRPQRDRKQRSGDGGGSDRKSRRWRAGPFADMDDSRRPAARG